MNPARIDKSKIDQLLNLSTDSVPGVVALVTTSEETIYEGAFGLRDASTDSKMTVDTVFWLASMTKAFTSAAALQLVEAGRLSLDAPIAGVLPELSAPNVFEGYADGDIPRLRPAAKAITLRHLLSHSSGYGSTAWHADLRRYLGEIGVPGLAESYTDLTLTPLLFDPGTAWQYGQSTDIVGKAIERTSGLRLDQYLAKYLLTPLGMLDTVVTLSSEQRLRLARMHVRNLDGSLSAVDESPGTGPTFLMGGGSYCGTGRDYLCFLRMILNAGTFKGAQILSPFAVENMLSNQLANLPVTPLRTVDPATNDVDFLPDVEKKWSAAFMMNMAKTAEGRNAGSLFWAGAANTFFWIDPRAGIAGVLLLQIRPFCDGAALRLFEAFERIVYETAEF